MTTLPATPTAGTEAGPLPVEPPPDTSVPAQTGPPEAPGPATPAVSETFGRSSPDVTRAQIVLTPPGPELLIGGGPYIVPISISGATQISDLTVTLVYSSALLRVRAVQEGSFMRQGGTTATFSQDVDQGVGRVDLTITRVDDSTGASGAGLLAAVLFEASAPGQAELEASGVARTPSGGLVPLAFSPISLEVR
jgi:hypothetical protein